MSEQRKKYNDTFSADRKIPEKKLSDFMQSTLGHVPAEEWENYKKGWSLRVEALRLQKEENVMIVPPAMFEQMKRWIPDLKYTQSPFNTYSVDYTQVVNELCKIGIAFIPDTEPPVIPHIDIERESVRIPPPIKLSKGE
jgi:hypothetical protein